ncbi:MAG: PAC2 family protein [Bifidobacteriaceae bacterium]|nr:PAC2 family protein [Bifidobacteriaceae bacterium]
MTSTDLFSVDDAAAAVLESRGAGPVLIYALDGFVDAGIVAGLAVNDFVVHGGAQRVVTFDSDQLVDYRSRRPPMLIGDSGWDGITLPDIGIDVVRDSAGVAFLLLYGPEPDLKWDRFADAICQIAERFHITRAIGMHGVPMAVPHTRPLQATVPVARARAGREIGEIGPKLQVPGSAQALIEHRLAQAGLDSMTLAVHVPHYLAALPFAAGSVELLGRIGEVADLDFDLSRLARGAERTGWEIARQMERSEDLAGLVRELEQRYDDAEGGGWPRPAGGPADLTTALPTVLPSADELAAELEDFLASQGTGPETGEA